MTPSAENRHWAQIGESTFLFGIAALYWVHRMLGRRCFTFLLGPVVLFYWLVRPGLRANSLQYLQRIEAATGALGHTPTWRDGCRHVTLFAETMLDKLLAVSGRYQFKSVKMSGREVLLPGCVIVTAHLGCLELCRTMGDRFGGKKLNILVHTRHAEKFNSILKRLNPDNALRLIEVSEINPMTMVMLSEKIAAGEIVIIAGDRVPVFASQTVQTDFLGYPANFPVGPYVMAHLLKCPMILLGCIHEGTGYSIHFELLAERVELPRGQRAAALQNYAAQYAAAVTGLLRRSPYDWFNFFPFWRQASVTENNTPHVKKSA